MPSTHGGGGLSGLHEEIIRENAISLTDHVQQLMEGTKLFIITQIRDIFLTFVHVTCVRSSNIGTENNLMQCSEPYKYHIMRDTRSEYSWK